MALAGAAQADEQALAISGFGTVGLTSQAGAGDWGFQRNSSQPGARSSLAVSQDSRLGVQLNWNPHASWDGAMQIVGAQRPAGTPLGESVEWAYVGYRPLPDTRIRVGRTSPDIFLYADSRNVGYAFAWARPPVDFYGFAPGTSVDGIDLEQRWTLGDANWRARLTAGSFTTSVTDTNGSRLPLRGRDIIGLGITREDNAGLLLKASYFRSRVRVDAGDDVQQLDQGLQQLAALPVPGLSDSIAGLRENLWTGGSVSYLALGAQYDLGPWSFVAEGSDLKVPRSPLGGRRGYLSAGYRVHDITYYALASRVKPDRPSAAAPELAGSLAPLLGAQAAAGAQQLVDYAAAAVAVYRFDQSTIGVGLRWDCTPRSALKLQVDRFDVHANGAAGWRNGDTRAAGDTLVSLLLDFVWGP